MRVAIIPEDGTVVIDGRGFSNLVFTSPANVHAMTWDGTAGEIQVKNAAGLIVSNDTISDLTDWQPALDAWEAEREIADFVPEEVVPTQKELDLARYTSRAAAKDRLIAYMATDNLTRVRMGVWTVPELVALSEDPAVTAMFNDVSTLSFELAVTRLAAIPNPLLTQAIKDDWTVQLAAHFYNT